MDTQVNETEVQNAKAMDALTVVNEERHALIEKSLPDSPMTPPMMLALLVQKGDMVAAEKFMALAERWEANEAKKLYTAAMSKFRAKCPTIARDKHVACKQTHYTHASLASSIKQIRALMTECGLAHSWRTKQDANIVTVACVLTHVDGHSEETTLSSAPDTSGAKNSLQAIGSACSYLQRYTLFAILGLASSDDDDGVASGPPAQPDTLTVEQLTTPPPSPVPPAPPSNSTTSAAAPAALNNEVKGKKEFVLVCNTLAMDAGLLKEGANFTKEGYQSLLTQAEGFANTKDIAEATKWAMFECAGIIETPQGIAFLDG